MKKVLLLTLIPFICVLLSNTASAHEGRHANVLSRNEISTKAKQLIDKAANIKKIDETWLEAELVSVSKKTANSSDEWLVTFNNPTLASNNRLYIFFTLDGEFLAMNYTGK